MTNPKITIKIIFFVIISLFLLACSNTDLEASKTDEIVSAPELSENSSPHNSEISETSSITVFHNVNLISMIDDKILENYSVVIVDGIINQVAKAEEISLPENAKIIDGEGKYLMPGLVDMHVHIGIYRYEEVLYLANGVTGIQNMWGRVEDLNTRAFNERNSVGLRIYTTGPLMDGADPIWKNSTVLENREDARKAVLRVKEQGYDSVKVYEKLSLDVYQEIMETAGEIDIKVVGHVPRNVGLGTVLKLRQNSIEHLSGYSETNIETEAKMTAENNVWNTPTLAIANIIKEESEIEGLEYVHPNIIKGWNDMKLAANYELFIDSLDKRQNLVKIIHQAGGRILAGTDANNPFVIPGFSLHDELEYLAGAGLTPYEVLKTATYNPAEFLEQLDKYGTIEEGKFADLILLSENPLEDVRNTKKLEGTMIRGIWFDRESLNEKLENLKDIY